MKTVVICLVSMFIGGFFHELISSFITEKYQFISIIVLVGLDSWLGLLVALKNKEGIRIKKVLWTIVMLGSFLSLLGTLLTIEKGFPFVPFLSEVVLTPIVVFLILRSLKSMERLEWISGKVFRKILSNIDLHKNYQPLDLKENE